MSALLGDNVVDRSANMPWYQGSTLLHHLEEVHISSDRNLVDVRFPVQYVIRPQSTEHHDYRGYAGTVRGGVLRPVTRSWSCRPGSPRRIKSIDEAGQPIAEAFPPMSVTVRLEDEIDISRGDMICRPNNQPTVGQDLEAMVCWMADTSQLRAGQKLAIKHTTKWARAMVKELHYRLDVNTLHRDEASDALSLNEIGRVTLRTTQPLFYDEYRRNRQTGSFILVDEATNVTVGAGMIDPADVDTPNRERRLARQRQSLAPIAGRRPAPRAGRCGSPGCRAPGSRRSPSRSNAIDRCRNAGLPARRRQPPLRAER